ncbi:MAG: lysophospholipase [Oscillospiraceae bacterium]|nr:lysophospholipase [Oscillospiraceae bacterium]
MGFEKITGYFKSSNGVNDIAYYVYTPKTGGIKGVVQLVHGMCEYLTRYEPFAEFLCDRGYAVTGHDHLGHGASVNSDEELGFFAEKNGWRYLVKDMVTLSGMMKKRFEGKPFFIIGHSMGSLVLRTALTKYSHIYDGAVIMDTISAGLGINAALAGIEAIGKLKGKRSRSRLIDGILFGFSNARLKTPETRYDWICTDMNVVRAYAEDPKCTFLFTTQAMYDLAMMVKYVSAADWSAKTDKALPVLVMGGSEDPVGEYGKYPKELFNCLVNSGAQDVEFKLYDGLRHELLNEVGKEEIFGDIYSWLESHVEKGVV